MPEPPLQSPEHDRRIDYVELPTTSIADTLIVIFAVDLAAAEARVVRAGGSISKPAYSFPGGRRFHFRDPGGNELAVWSDR